MGKQILLVEDDQRIMEITSDYFAREGFVIYQAYDGRQALDYFQNNEIDLVILDIMLPHVDGWSVCKRMRKTSSVPIIMLTARAEEDDKLMGYELGADDYVTKPFSPKILVAKSKSLLKRAEGAVGLEDGIVSYHGIEVHPLSRTVRIDRNYIDLTPKEYELLLYLMENKNIVLSREAILDRVWGYDFFGDTRVVDTHIKKLRSKLQDKACHIATVIGSGYKFEVK